MRNHAYYDVGVTIRQTGRSKDCPKNFLVFVIKIGDNIALNGDFNIHEHTSVYAVPPEELIPIDKGAKHSLRFSVQQFFFFQSVFAFLAGLSFRFYPRQLFSFLRFTTNKTSPLVMR